MEFSIKHLELQLEFMGRGGIKSNAPGNVGDLARLTRIISRFFRACNATIAPTGYRLIAVTFFMGELCNAMRVR